MMACQAVTFDKSIKFQLADFGVSLLWFEWEKGQNGIVMLRDQLNRQHLDHCTRGELLNDIEGLLGCKNELAEKLGFATKK
jgi:hypothetical protein